MTTSHPFRPDPEAPDYCQCGSHREHHSHFTLADCALVPRNPETGDFVLSGSEGEHQRSDCEKALRTLAGAGYVTPAEGYGSNSSWAISDLCSAITQISADRAAVQHQNDCLNEENRAVHEKNRSLTESSLISDFQQYASRFGCRLGANVFEFVLKEALQSRGLTLEQFRAGVAQ